MKSVLIIFCTLFATSSFARTAVKPKKEEPKRTYSYENYDNKTNNHVWDFTGMLGLYNPGTGFGAKAAYRIVGDLLPSANDSLSVEAGITFISVSDTVAGISSSYSVMEIPIHARWDFFVYNQKLVVGPVAGINYLTGSSVTVNGVSYSISRSGGVFMQLGGSGIYYFTENLGARAELLIGSYTTLGIGINYAL